VSFGWATLDSLFVSNVLDEYHSQIVIRKPLRRYATGRKVAGSIPDEVGFFNSFPPHYSSGVDSASNRNEYQDSS
jgi:hypothetical protein